MKKPKIAVVGSINLDLVANCDNLPQAGETIRASDLTECYGGKGANQAVAAARAGAEVCMIGRVGNDTFGPSLLKNLQQQDVNCQRVKPVPGPSGLAMIAVDAQGENSILIVPGANAALQPKDVIAAADDIAQCDLLLLQLEIPIETVQATIEVAHECRLPILLDPAPAPQHIPTHLLDVDWICPNETEAALLTGQPVTDLQTAQSAAEQLHQQGTQHVVITRGVSGCLHFDGHKFTQITAPTVNCIDSTAAGDAFAGALGFALAAKFTVEDALQFACTAGALACTQLGAQAAIATQQEIMELNANTPSS